VPAFLVPLLAARRAGQEPILVAIVALSAASVLGLIVAEGAAPLWMVLLGVGQGGALGLALILPVLRGGAPAAVASLTAMMLSIGYLGAALGPWIAGVLHDATGGWGATLGLLLGVSLLQFLPGLAASRDRSLRQTI
jgi:MFS transporter, CP family, cyanate transporter